MACKRCIDEICQGKCRRVKEKPIVSMYYVGQPKTDSDEDLLQGNESAILSIGGQEYQAPITGWTHALIHKFCNAYANRYGTESEWKVFIGTRLVGGTAPLQ